MDFRKRVLRPIAAGVLALSILIGGFVAPTTTTLASTSITMGGQAVITNTDGSTIRMRADAGSQNDQVGEAYEGDVVVVIAGPRKDTKGNWWYGIKSRGNTGWVLSDFLENKSAASSSSTSSSSSSSSPSSSLAVGGRAIVAGTDGDTVRMRKGASTQNDQVGEANEGDVLSVIGGPRKDSQGNVWYQVKGDGGTGWIISDYLARSTAAFRASSSASKSTASASAKPSTVVTKSAPKMTGTVRVANTDGDPLRLRTDPDSSADIVTLLAADSTMSIRSGPITDSDGVRWYKVTAGGSGGWVMAQYLAQATSSSTKATAAPAAAKSASSSASQPAIQAKPAAKAADTKPAAPAPTAKPKAAANTRAGTAQAQTVSSVAPSSQGQGIVDVAMNYVGYRYIFGGTTPRGFDCSGFVYYVLNKAGVSISRDMYSQFTSGPRVSSSSLQPGDLVFFSNTYKAGLSHTGIYVGNGKFIHAENESTGVVVSQLWSSYWAAHYTAAVRPQ